LKLLIISHTEHYKTTDGTIVGWSPTVNEINHLAPHFESVTHMAMLHNTTAPQSVMPYTATNSHFEALPPLGGQSLFQKLKTLMLMPLVIYKVHKALRKADVFQLRTPTGIAVFLIPYLTLFSKKNGWYKYAGNWMQTRPPLGYRVQRWLLKHQNRLVTINGKWHNQPQHCLTFENPCLSQNDIDYGKQLRSSKTIDGKINFCYVGRLETSKGIGRIIEAFTKLTAEQKSKVGTLHLVGHGNEIAGFEDMAKSTDINIVFHGFLHREDVLQVYKNSHVFVMPTTASEGFPKVIAEAANFGCLPIVSNVSSIAQYIRHQQNGLIIQPVTTDGLLAQLETVFNMTRATFSEYINKNEAFVEQFTFSYYNHRILNEILV